MKQYAENLTALPAKGDPARTREGIANPPTGAYLTRRSFAYAFGSDARDARAWIKGESGDLIAEGGCRIADWVPQETHPQSAIVNPRCKNSGTVPATVGCLEFRSAKFQKGRRRSTRSLFRCVGMGRLRGEPYPPFVFFWRSRKNASGESGHLPDGDDASNLRVLRSAASSPRTRQCLHVPPGRQPGSHF